MTHFKETFNISLLPTEAMIVCKELKHLQNKSFINFFLFFIFQQSMDVTQRGSAGGPNFIIIQMHRDMASISLQL